MSANRNRQLRMLNADLPETNAAIMEAGERALPHLIERCNMVWHPKTYGGFNPRSMEYGVRAPLSELFIDANGNQITDWRFSVAPLNWESLLFAGRDAGHITPDGFVTIWTGLLFEGADRIQELRFQVSDRMVPRIFVSQMALQCGGALSVLLFPDPFAIDEFTRFEINIVPDPMAFVNPSGHITFRVIMLGYTACKREPYARPMQQTHTETSRREYAIIGLHSESPSQRIPSPPPMQMLHDAYQRQNEELQRRQAIETAPSLEFNRNELQQIRDYMVAKTEVEGSPILSESDPKLDEKVEFESRWSIEEKKNKKDVKK